MFNLTDDNNNLEDDLDLNLEESAGGQNSKKEVSGQKEESFQEKQIEENKDYLLFSLLKIKNELEAVIAFLQEGLENKSKVKNVLKEGKEKGKETVIEGFFTGEAMLSSEGKRYTVPANYASKSKLVEGDSLRLTIKPDGQFIYKQIGPVLRSRLSGTLVFDESAGQFYVAAQGRKWKLLKAAVTFFGGKEGDEVIFLIPKDTPSQWGAVESIVSK